MLATYYINDDVYKVTTDVDTDSTYAELVQIQDTLDAEYLERMNSAEVKLDVLKNGKLIGCMYLENDEYRSMAVSLYSKDVYGLIVMWYTLWESTKVKQIVVSPHNREDVRMYQSVASSYSLRQYLNGSKGYIVIKVNELVDKIGKFMDGVTHVSSS